MKRLLFATTAVAVLVAACSGGSAPAATVNGTDISTDDVQSLIFNAGDALPADQFTQLLDILVQWRAIADAVQVDFGIDPSAAEIADEVDRLYTEQGTGSTFEEFLQTQNISEKGLQQYAEQLLIGDAVLKELEPGIEQPTDDEAQQALAEDPMAWTEVCAAHILVGTAEDAAAVQARLDAGEDFASVATEVSLDTGSGAAGGTLPCASPDTYVPEFGAATMTAEPGEVVGPVETQFGFHLIRVDSRTEATFEQVRSGLYDQRVAEAVDTWYQNAVAGAQVEIDEQYGTWVTDPVPSIVAPQP